MARRSSQSETWSGTSGAPTAPSNTAFDASLNARDPEWGLRRLSAVIAEADAVGLRFEQRIAMPANNLTLVFRS